MARIALALLALAAALLLGLAASQPPAAKPADAPASAFSAQRAMADVRTIARAPRPTGSAEIERVRTYLLGRLRALGMKAAARAVPLPERSVEKLRRRGVAVAEPVALNLVGVLPGRDRQAPALLLMAHYDSVPQSPGAPDDAAGVAAALEIVRALKAGGQPARDVIVLFTDAEEVGLVGARNFFGRDPLARRVGAVINMESRGGGGRVAMFETGRGNGAMIELYRRSVARPSSNSLAVLVYELMPNNTDFTIPKDLGIAGFNFAFIGEGRFYHSPAATPDALDVDTLQDLGAQALGVSRALAFTPGLLPKAEDPVFGDVLGRFVIAYRPAVGWAVLAVGALLLGFAAVRARIAGREIAAGAATAMALLLHAALVLIVANLVSGTIGANYYDRLAALPRLELQAGLLCLAVLLVAAVAARPQRRILAAAPALLLTVAGIALDGSLLPLLGIGIGAALFAALMPVRGAGLWGGWLGLALPVLLLALLAQIFAPGATPLLAWPLALAAIGMAAAAAFDRELDRAPLLALLAVLAAIGGGQILYLAHFTFLGIGAKTPEAMALHSLLFALLVWPLVRRAAAPRAFGIAAAALALVAVGISLSVRLDPIAETVPPYSLKP